MNKLEDFKKYHYLAVIKDCRLEYFDLESVSSKYTDYVTGDIVRVEDFDLRFNAELTIKDLNVSSRSFKMFFADFLNHYFIPYQPKFEVGDIVTNHHDLIFSDESKFPMGTVFEVTEIIEQFTQGVHLRKRNAFDNVLYTMSMDDFIMCNPRAYMR